MKYNYLSIILASIAILAAVATFFIACCRFEPFTLTDSSMNYALTVLVGLLAVAITVIIGVQIVYILNVDKRFKEAIEAERKVIEMKNDEIVSDFLRFTMAVYKAGISDTAAFSNNAFIAFISRCNTISDIDKIVNKNDEIVSFRDQQLGSIVAFMTSEKHKADIMEGMKNEPISLNTCNEIREALLNTKNEKAYKISSFMGEVIDFLETEENPKS